MSENNFLNPINNNIFTMFAGLQNQINSDSTLYTTFLLSYKVCFAKMTPLESDSLDNYNACFKELSNDSITYSH